MSMDIHHPEEIIYEHGIPFCPECNHCLSVSQRGNLYCSNCKYVFIEIEFDDYDQDTHHPGHPHNYGDRPN